jgi:hypothetical protein
MILRIRITSDSAQKLYNVIQKYGDGDTWALQRLKLEGSAQIHCYIYYGRNINRVQKALATKDWCTYANTFGW